MVLGGGRRHFVPKVVQDVEEPDKEGRRLDGRNLIEEWSRNHRLRNVAAKFVANKEQFDNVDPRKVNHLLGNVQDTRFYIYRGGVAEDLLAMNFEAGHVTRTRESRAHRT